MGTWGKIALPGRIGQASHRSLDGEFLAHLLLGHRRAPVAGSSFSHPRLVLLKSHVIRELPVIRPITRALGHIKCVCLLASCGKIATMTKPALRIQVRE